MDVVVCKLPKKRKFDPSELEETDNNTVCVTMPPVLHLLQAVDYSVKDEEIPRKQTMIDLSEWRDHRVLAKQLDRYYPGVIRQASGTDVSCNLQY